MFPTFLLFLVRRLLRNKAFSLLNIFGLAIGVGASILIFLVVRWETSYDSYHTRKDRIFRVVTTTQNRSNREVTETHGYAPISLGDVIGREVSGVESVAATRFNLCSSRPGPDCPWSMRMPWAVPSRKPR